MTQFQLLPILQPANLSFPAVSLPSPDSRKSQQPRAGSPGQEGEEMEGAQTVEK